MQTSFLRSGKELQITNTHECIIEIPPASNTHSLGNADLQYSLTAQGGNCLQWGPEFFLISENWAAIYFHCCHLCFRSVGRMSRSTIIYITLLLYYDHWGKTGVKILLYHILIEKNMTVNLKSKPNTYQFELLLDVLCLCSPNGE